MHRSFSLTYKKVPEGTHLFLYGVNLLSYGIPYGHLESTQRLHKYYCFSVESVDNVYNRLCYNYPVYT